MVLARPGTPSIRTWPPVMRPMTRRSTMARWPTMTRSTAPMSVEMVCAVRSISRAMRAESGMSAPGRGARAEGGEVGTALGGHRGEAADLDGDAGEVGEAAEGVGGDLGGAVADLAGLDGIAQLGVGDELGGDELVAQQGAEERAVFA